MTVHHRRWQQHVWFYLCWECGTRPRMCWTSFGSRRNCRRESFWRGRILNCSKNLDACIMQRLSVLIAESLLNISHLQAYFITNMEEIKFWEFMSLVLEGLGYDRYFFYSKAASYIVRLKNYLVMVSIPSKGPFPVKLCSQQYIYRYLWTSVICRPKLKIPASVVMPIAHIVEIVYKILAPYGMKVPQLTPSRIRLLSITRTFDCTKANKLLGYTPIVPLQV